MPIVRGFWDDLKLPIVGLSPMDGVTDAAYRYIVAKNSHPSVIMTEFTNVEGLARGAVKMLKAFDYNEIERPVVAQIYGVELESFYKVTLMVCYLGFDGVDINMGCPANKVARRGSGAGMIGIPEHAQKAVRMVKKACQDWANGITLGDAKIRPKVINYLKKIRPEEYERKHIPTSVKTRTGIDEIVTEWWINNLLEEEPANLSLHGRTLKQMYTGQANWEEIAKAGALCKNTPTSFLGNGDVKSMEDAREKTKKYDIDGVLVGRATFGNPWFFSDHEPSIEDRFNVAIEHADYFENHLMEHAFFAMRKHLAWYCKGFDGAREIRGKLMQTTSTDQVREILEEALVKLRASGVDTANPSAEGLAKAEEMVKGAKG